MSIPHVVLTSNGTRELSDALRRRCLYHYVDYPAVDREARIIAAHIPDAGAALSLQIARMVEKVRKEDLRKAPGVAEALDWAAAFEAATLGGRRTQRRMRIRLNMRRALSGSGRRSRSVS